jgi:hypothetical protein
MNPLDPVLAPPAPPPSRGPLTLLALLGALVPAAILAVTATSPTPLAAIPAVTFGVPAMTAPALYVALTWLGDAPPLRTVAGALARGLLAMALVQLGLAVPLGFLVTTAGPDTAQALVAAAVALAGAVAMVAIDDELGARSVTLTRTATLWCWVAATVVIAVRMYAEASPGVSP